MGGLSSQTSVPTPLPEYLVIAMESNVSYLTLLKGYLLPIVLVLNDPYRITGNL